MKIAILILAAGSSARMGVTKQLLPFGKNTLLGITIEHALQSNADTVYCVLGSNAIKAANGQILTKQPFRISLQNFKTDLNT